MRVRIGLVVVAMAHAAARGTSMRAVRTRAGAPPRMDCGQADFEFELAFAARIAREAGHLLIDPTTPELATSQALQCLEFELQHEPAVSVGAEWVRHVDEHIISIALVDAERGPLVGVVCRPWTKELLCASVDGGAFVQHGDGPLTPTPPIGMASKYANIIHVPHDRCPELDLAIESLSEKMPVDVTRLSGCCCCEGLFEVVSGRADAHVSPPERCYMGQQRTPVPVLCAFEVLLGETGGYMSDVLGNEIDLRSHWASKDEHRGGVVASDSSSHNWFISAIRSPFAKPRLLLPNLAETIGSDALAFRVEYVGGEERIMLDGGGWELDDP